MEKTRLTLQTLLEQILGSRNVYFSPPSSLNMKYPCIRYQLADMNDTPADNIAYMRQKKYTLTYIDSNPDSVIPDKILEIPYCSFDRPYTSDNLNHFVFILYW